MESSFREQINSSSYRTRTPHYYLDRFHPEILSSFSSQQLDAITQVLGDAIPKPSPKIVDLRFVVDLIFSRFYIVLFVGKDRRKNKRAYNPSGVAKFGNAIAAIALLIGTNLVISALILLFAYLIKSAMSIELFPGEHISDTIQRWIP